MTSGSDAVWIDFVVFPPLGGSEECSSGDLNGDDINNVLDVVLLVNCVLGENCEICASDMNQDGVLNVLDVVILATLILSHFLAREELFLEKSTNGDGFGFRQTPQSTRVILVVP